MKNKRSVLVPQKFGAWRRIKFWKYIIQLTKSQIDLVVFKILEQIGFDNRLEEIFQHK